MHATIPVSEIMVRSVVTATPETTVSEAAQLLREHDVSSVVVCRDEGPVGIVTEGDFATCLCERADAGELALETVMATPLVTVEPTDSILETVERLREAGVEHLPVVASAENGDERDELVGIVTTTELAYFVPQLIHRSVERHEVPPVRQVRTDTAYERDDWEFDYHGADESTVSVGDVARFAKTITADDVERFAEISGDTNRLHLESDYASETRFGERIVHGALANGLISAALARLPGLTIYLSQESTFLAPISIGDRVTATCEIVDDLGDAKYRVETTVLAGDETVLEGESVVLIDPLPSMAAVRDEAAA